MSVQFLVNGIHPDGTPGLVSITREEWLKIIEENENLPEESRRYFYRDGITDHGSHDYIFMEVPKEMYDEWRNQMRRVYRNYEAQNEYSLVSFDELLENGMEEPLDNINVENVVLDKVFTEEIKKAIQGYSPWASELLQFYLSGEKDLTINFLMNRCNVVRQSANRYRRDFENFIKKLLEN